MSKHHVQALTNDGHVRAWGLNDKGQCNIPKDLKKVQAIATGTQQSLALQTDGTVRIWGSNNAAPSDLQDVIAIDAIGQHSIALGARRPLRHGLPDDALIASDPTQKAAPRAAFFVPYNSSSNRSDKSDSSDPNR